MNERIKVNFYLNTYRKDKSEQSPIMCRLVKNKEIKQFSIGLKCKRQDWDKNIKEIVDSHEAYLKNKIIRTVKQKLEEIIYDYYLNNEPLTIDKLYSIYTGNDKQKYTLCDAFEFHNNHIAKQVGKAFKKSTLKRYEIIYNHIKAFLREDKKINDIGLEDLNIAFLEDFQIYLNTVKGHNPNTYSHIIQRVRKIINHAIKYDWIDKDPFKGYQKVYYKKEVVFLTQTELEQLEAYKFAQIRLEQVKDAFIFCCYTGLPYNEYSQLRRKHFHLDGDRYWIKIERLKTSKNLHIPLLKKAKAILDKYGFDNNTDEVLPIISNQKFNSYLKEIGAVVGIDKNLTHHIARKTFASTVLLNNDVPMHVVSELLGHSSITITEEYYGKVVKDKLKKEIGRIEI